jgi:hypothetical protein
MQTHVLRQDAAPTTFATLFALRTHLTTLTFHSPYLSDAEKLRANHRIYDCEQLAQLELWLQTVPAELAWREATYNDLYEPCSDNGGRCLSLNTPLLHS